MEARVNDSEDEAQDTGQRSFNSRSSAMCAPSSKFCAQTSDNATMQSPICPSGNRAVVAERHLNTCGHMRDKEDKGSKTHDITAQGIPKSSMLAVSAKADVLAPIQTPVALNEEKDNAAVKNINSLNPIHDETKETFVGARALGTTSGARGTPSSSRMTVSGDCHLQSLNRIPTILNGKKDHVSGKYLVNHGQIDVMEAHFTRPLIGNWSVDKLNSSKVNGGRHQDNDQLSGTPTAAADRPNIGDRLTNPEGNPNSRGDSLSNNIKNPSNSKNASQKSLSPERADSNISSSGMRQQKVVDHANTNSIKGNEIIKHVDGLDAGYAERKKSLASPASLNPQKEDMVSKTSPETGLLDCPPVSRLSAASEPANVSFVQINPSEANSIDLGKQQSLSASRQSRSEKTSLKHGGPVNGVMLREYSSSGTNIKSLPKSRTSLKLMTENKCNTSPVTVQDGKTSSGFSFQNKDGEAAQASGNAVNHNCSRLMHETRNTCKKGQAHDTSVHSSQVVSCSGNVDTKITDALDTNDNGVAIASKFKNGKMVSDGNVKGGAKQFLDTSSNVQGKPNYSKEVPIPIGRSAGAKRRRSASMEADGSVVNCGRKLVPESRPAEVILHEHADPASKNGCNTASAAKLKTISPKKVPTSRLRNTAAKRTWNAHAKMDDAQLASNLEFSKAVSQENTEKNPQKSCDIANADGHKRNSPKKLPNTRVRNTATKRSWKFETDMNNEALVDKTETVAAESLFDDLFSSDNVEDCHNKLSSNASASDCGTLSPKTVSNARVRNGVAKRKIKAIEGKGSNCGKIGSAIASVGKAILSNKDGTGDVSGLFCQDSVTVDKTEAPHNSKLRSSKRNKVLISDHEKENRQGHSNLKSKSKVGAGNLCSKSNAKSMQKSTDVLSERQMIKENESEITSKPALFILSGNRQQRREYRSILRRLKGRVCSDSHRWLCKASHFIATDPLRRTEKFFAAAAAGRWILKRDYLSSCAEAGKFLDEEPFEWFGTGLSDGEKISLEAPRKWRILRQQMGHGAFYGMQIIVYGQLILPNLDTLRRAVRSGDGTILATSPPYTRFLNSGVDFAVVSAGMPSADAWVQEFIRHGIPCVSADYLVEYVCKPGHPLDKHVLFKTNDLANKSLKKLLKNQQEMATDEPELSEDEDNPENLTCSVCGRKDREEVMLICGDEEGTVGCGIGMHIDCCDPPMEAVPDDDWLCPKCDAPKAKSKPARSTGRKTRASKQR
ncbi:hypothetical protein ACP70R_014016 [Stipagrostis hirtigluma subsp. patula]